MFSKGCIFFGFWLVFLYHKIVYIEHYLDCTQIVYAYQFIPLALYVLSHQPSYWVTLCTLSWSIKSMA